MGGVHKLSARKVATVRVAGRLSDGAGLYLYVKKTGRKSWIYMWKKEGLRREMGLGGYPAVSLAKARLKAQIQRELISEGEDPLAARAKAKSVHKVTTFGEAAKLELAVAIISRAILLGCTMLSFFLGSHHWYMGLLSLLMLIILSLTTGLAYFRNKRLKVLIEGERTNGRDLYSAVEVSKKALDMIIMHHEVSIESDGYRVSLH